MLCAGSSSFTGVAISASRPAQQRACAARVVRVEAAIAEATEYKSPTWSVFEMDGAPVYLDTVPTAGETMTIFFNPSKNGIISDGCRFNGGFNGPFMCGGEPRAMAKVDRGVADSPFYSIRINVPKHAMFLEFSFTDGQMWDEGYKIMVKPAKGLEGKDKAFMDIGLAAELAEDGACEASIFPDPAPEADTVDIGASIEVGATCTLDLETGCTDPSSPNYNPLATVENGECEVDFD
mmetsp:Transcript_24491/g.77423  ORF Transcript_24491/g.77423 Transcript_24491/m.77423 type:complete len:236 (-) Transcript_24491:633-1340(-)